MANRYDSEIVEPEEKPAYVDVNPLDEAVNEKKYSQPNISATAEELNRPIEEPRFTPPPIERPKVEREDFKKREPFNPEMKDIPKKDKEMAAAAMATIVLQGYEWLHDLGNKALTISEKKLAKLQEAGEINLNAMIDYDYGRQMRAGDFFKEYNAQVGNSLKVSDEFKEEVRPVLERVLAKRGVGMTDEQLLMFMFGKDIAAKGLMFVQQKQQQNYMIQSIREATAGQFVQQAPPPPPQPEPEPQPQAQSEYQPQQRQRQEPQQQEEAPFVDSEEDFTVTSSQAPTGNDKPNIIVLPKRRGRPKN
jgi:hypothetical protein